MMTRGMSGWRARDYKKLLADHHSISVRVRILDLDHRHLDNVSGRLLAGQVTVDVDAEIVRSLDLELLDPTHSLSLDSKSPNNGAMFADRMIQVTYTTISPLGDRRYSTNVFTGPIVKLDRTGAITRLTCHGKEIFGLSPAWRTKTYKKGQRVTWVIRNIVKQMMGEKGRFVHVPNLNRKLDRNVSVGGDKSPWKVAKRLAASIGYQLYFDGNGICRMRKYPTGTQFVFRGGKGGTLITEPEIGFSMDHVYNAVEVIGKTPKRKKGKKKKRAYARRVAWRRHPLSPWSLGRNGGPRFIPVTIEDDGITNKKQARRKAKNVLKRGLREHVEVAYDTLPIPPLEEMDIALVRTEKFAAKHRIRKFAIPLNASGVSSMGYVRNVKPRRGRIRGHRRGRRRN